MGEQLTIGEVERETGLPKDTLRKWEQRYGFPQPERDRLGDRLYPRDQVERLRLLRAAVDRGHRVGAVVHLPVEQLAGLAPAPAPQVPAAGSPVEGCMAFVREGQPAALQDQLARLLAVHGVARFIAEVATPLLHATGDAWAAGRLSIYEEHLVSDAVARVLRDALRPLEAQHGDGLPRVLLSTLPGEQHGLALLMLECRLRAEGVACHALGAQTPVGEIAAAARALRVDVVALSASSAMRSDHLRAWLAELRTLLPENVAIWVGGSAEALRQAPPAGVLAMTDFDTACAAARAWRETAAAAR